MKIPKHHSTVISSLEATIKAGQEKKRKPTKEESVQEIPGTFHGKVWLHLDKVYHKAEMEAKDLSSPGSHILCERFPQELYDELMKSKRHSFLEDLNQLGFEFYLTNEGNFETRHPMVKFTFDF